MSIISIVLIAIVVAIIVKTGSLGKALGFLAKYLLFPIIGAFGGALIGLLLGGEHAKLCTIIGLIIGVVLVIKDAKNKVK